MAKIVHLIEVEIARGNGRTTILRGVKQYWTLKGELVAEVDPCPNDNIPPDTFETQRGS